MEVIENCPSNALEFNFIIGKHLFENVRMGVDDQVVNVLVVRKSVSKGTEADEILAGKEILDKA